MAEENLTVYSLPTLRLLATITIFFPFSSTLSLSLSKTFPTLFFSLTPLVYCHLY